MKGRGRPHISTNVSRPLGRPQETGIRMMCAVICDSTTLGTPVRGQECRVSQGPGASQRVRRHQRGPARAQVQTSRGSVALGGENWVKMDPGLRKHPPRHGWSARLVASRFVKLSNKLAVEKERGFGSIVTYYPVCAADWSGPRVVADLGYCRLPLFLVFVAL